MTYKRERIVESIERALKSAFKSLHKKGASNVEWTRIIKERLCEEGKGLGFKCAASIGGLAHYGEWLFDLVWLDYMEEGETVECLRGVPLIVESEWGDRGDVEDDFEKLMVGRSIVKLLIYDGRYDADNKVPPRLACLLQEFSQRDNNDLYLLAAYTEKGFHFQRLMGDGTL